jgi:predicted nuclease of predicted toxin-antitoxin system
VRILLDENFPADFAKIFADHDIHTVHSLGWSGVKNGELLRRAHAVCDVFVTLDRNLEHQQNVKVLSFGIVVVRAASNRMADLLPHMSVIISAASRVGPGQIEHVGV